jgi:hypothetical protein
MVTAALKALDRRDSPSVRVRVAQDHRPANRRPASQIRQRQPIVWLDVLGDDKLEDFMGADAVDLHGEPVPAIDDYLVERPVSPRRPHVVEISPR